jgi:hypothetical protein
MGTTRLQTAPRRVASGCFPLSLPGVARACCRTEAAATHAPHALPAPASIHYAPAVAVPRLSRLPVAPTDEDAVMVFCLRSEDGEALTQARRLLQRALGQLKDHGVRKVYAFATLAGSPADQDRCQFFSLDFLESNGFQPVTSDDDIYLMRADLRGLLALASRAQSLVRRALAHDPAPSPAAWTRRGTP